MKSTKHKLILSVIFIFIPIGLYIVLERITNDAAISLLVTIPFCLVFLLEIWVNDARFN